MIRERLNSNNLSDGQPWLSFFGESSQMNDQTTLLLCFPFAGAGPSIYRDWCFPKNSHIQIAGVQLPGREIRIKDRLHISTQSLIPYLAERILPLLPPRFAFFGHSMGALLAYEMAKYLQQYSNISPTHLFLSSRRSPDIPDRFQTIHNLPDDQFLARMAEYGATPPELFDNKELIKLFLPILRADFQLCESYEYSPTDRLSVDLTVLGAVHDPFVHPEELQGWQNKTRGVFGYKLFEGGHFYLKECKTELLSYIHAQMCKKGS